MQVWLLGNAFDDFYGIYVMQWPKYYFATACCGPMYELLCVLMVKTMARISSLVLVSFMARISSLVNVSKYVGMTLGVSF